MCLLHIVKGKAALKSQGGYLNIPIFCNFIISYLKNEWRAHTASTRFSIYSAISLLPRLFPFLTELQGHD